MAQIVPRFDFRIRFHAEDDIGRHRQSHEDAFLVAPDLALFALADGMGGHRAGEVAARLAIEAVKRSIGGRPSQAALDAYVRKPNLETRRRVLARVRRSVEKANEVVRAEAEKNPDWQGMGTTIDVACLARDHAFIAHAGDARVYLARSTAVLQLTHDHAELDTLKAAGVLRPQAGRSFANRLINAVGIGDSILVDTLFVDLTRGDRLLLCSDGVHGQIDSEAEIGDLLRKGSVENAAAALVERAGKRGRDNATAVVVEVGERFVRREASDRGMRARDVERAKLSPLLVDLPTSKVMGALSAAVEVEVAEGAHVPQVVASDLVSYIVLDGLVSCPGDRIVSVGALLFAESLVGVHVRDDLPITQQPTRLLRLRADDFAEVCESDPTLAVALYRRLATHLARSAQPRRLSLRDPGPRK